MQYMKLLSKNKKDEKLIAGEDITRIKGKLYVFVVEPENNLEILKILRDKYNVVTQTSDDKMLFINNTKYYKCCELCGKGEMYSIQNQDKVDNLLSLIHLCHVIVIGKVKNIKVALEIVDETLATGREIICIRDSFSKENYMSNYLIKNGAEYI